MSTLQTRQRTKQPAARSAPAEADMERVRPVQSDAYAALSGALHKATIAPAALSPADGAVLQRTAGNRATGALLGPVDSADAIQAAAQRSLAAIVQRSHGLGMRSPLQTGVTSRPSLTPVVQPKLMLGAVDDGFEREADAVAAQVVHQQPHAVRTSDKSGVAGSSLQRALARFAPRPATSASAAAPTATIIQRKGTHFWQYLTSKAPGLDPTQQSDSDLLISAWLLDQNIYELQSLLSGDAAPDFENMSKLTNAGLTLNDVAAYLNRCGAPPAIKGRELQLEFLSQFVANVPTNLTTEISNRTHNAVGKQSSKIKWMGLTPWGAGTGVELHMLPGGLPQGSQPSSEPVWMKTVEQHLPAGGNTTLYVRGHLLNHNIGGPGLDYNMVPITGKPAKNVGANDANAEHLRAIEAKAKETWDEVKAGKLREALYRVVPEYNRASRPESAFVRQQATLLRQILDSAVQAIFTHYTNMQPSQLQQEFQKLQGQAPVTMHGGIAPLTTEQQAKVLAMNQTKNFEKATLAALVGANHPLAAAIVNQVNADVLNASAEGNALNMELGELLMRVIGNAETWEAEDRYIPTQLHVALHTVDTTGNMVNVVPPPVPVTLSTDMANVHYRPKKKNEDA